MQLGIAANTTLENYSNFKYKFLILLNNCSILEINDFCNNGRRENISLTELSEIINTLSNQDFAVFDKFRLKASTEKIKEMPLKMHETKKLNRNESSISDFFSSPFSPVMANLTAGSSAGENASLTLDKILDH